MLTNERDKRICDKYSRRDKAGRVHCCECPLAISNSNLMCKANAHYNRKTREWEFDEFEEADHE